MWTRTTAVGAILVRRGDADAMLCGTSGNYSEHLKYVRDIIGMRPGVKTLAALQMLILPGRQLFRLDELNASMRMAQPFPDVWLPDAIAMRFRAILAIGDVAGRYDVRYHDYRLASVTSKVR